MKYLKKLSLLVGLSLIGTNTFANARYEPNNPSPGAIKAQFEVSQSGAATYSMPIELPVGIGGLTPTLGFSYNSSGGNGLMGVGWSINGLSSITRCAATEKLDGYKKAPDFRGDKLCLDGQRLIEVPPSSGYRYEYRLAGNPGVRIAAKYGYGGAPSSIYVNTKDGLTKKYTPVWKVSDSPINDQNNVLASHMWNLSLIEDQHGNKIEFLYETDKKSTRLTNRPAHAKYISSISYKTHESVEIDVRFDWGQTLYTDSLRGDAIAGFSAREPINIDRSLKQVVVIEKPFGDQQAKQRYILQYKPSRAALNGKLVLESVTQCNMPNTLLYKYSKNEKYSDWLIRLYYLPRDDQSETCLPSTVFEWSGLGDELLPKYQESEQWQAPSRLTNPDDPRHQWSLMLDLNGDGLPDWIQGRKDHLKAWLNTGSGFRESSAFKPPKTMFDGEDIKAELVDVNADGLPDFVYQNSSNNNITEVRLNTGSGWAYSRYSNRLPVENYKGKYVVGIFTDLNQDGYTDFVYSRKGKACRAFYNRAKEQNGQPTWEEKSEALPCRNYDEMSLREEDGKPRGQLADIDGNGLPDWMINAKYTGNHQLKTYLLTNNGWKLSSSYSYTHTESLYSSIIVPTETGLYDLNGDGLLDLNCRALNTGIGFLQMSRDVCPQKPAYLSTRPDRNTASVFGDFDNNGQIERAVGDRTIGLPGIQWHSSSNRKITDIMPPHWNANPGEVAVGDINGDGLTDYLYTKKSTGLKTYLGKGAKTGLIKAITDGLGNKIEIDYHVLSDTKSSKSIYTPGSKNGGRGLPVILGKRVVSEHRSITAGKIHNTRYKYGDMRHDVDDDGMLGFRWMEVANATTGVAERTIYSHTYPYIGRAERNYRYFTNAANSISRLASCPTGQTYGLLSCGEQQYQYIEPIDNVKLIYAAESKQFEYSMSGQHLKTSITQNSNYDDYGNVGQVVGTVQDANTGEQWTKTNTNWYDNYPEEWHLGRLSRSKVVHTDNLGNQITKNASFEYDPRTRQLTAEITEPNHAGTPLYLRKDYTYDQWGNKNSIATTGYDYDGSQLPTRTAKTTTQYTTNSEGLAIKKVTTENALGHTEERHYSTSGGNLIYQKGPNGIATRWVYDNFGRKTYEYRADGTYSQIIRRWAQAGDPEGAVYVISGHSGLTQPVSGYPETIAGATEYFDAKGRSVHKTTVAIDGRLIHEKSRYNTIGQKSAVARKHFDGDPIYWANTEYDALGRTIKTLRPDGKVYRIEYDGFTMIKYDAKDNATTTTKNAQGKVVKVQDAAGGELQHFYDVTGALDYTIDPQRNRIDIDYDIHGRKLSMNDPAMGYWQYKYNSFGELRWQKNAKGQVTHLAYDKLGRMFRRGEGTNVARWYYDHLPGENLADAKANNSVGKLVKVTDQLGYSQENQYDHLGRNIASITTIQGEEYLNTVEYDPYSRVAKSYRPGTTDGTNDTPFELENLYNEFGHLTAIRSPIDQSDDYDFEHLAEIMLNVLAASEEASKEANRLMSDALAYQKEAQHYEQRAAQAAAGLSSNNSNSEAEKEAIRQQIQSLQATAALMNATAAQLEGYAQEYKNKAAALQARADLFHKYAKIYSAYSNSFYQWISSYYASIAEQEQAQADYNVTQAEYYLSQSAQQRASAKNQLQQAANLQHQLDTWADEPAEEVDYALLATESLNKAQAALAKADELKAKHDDYQSHVAMLQDNLADQNYATWWRADRVDAEGRVNRSMTGNGLLTTKDYNPTNGQLDYIYTGAGTYTTVQSLAYTYDDANNVDTINDDFSGSYSNYTYDNLDRIKTYQYQDNDNTDSDSWDYDSVGNITRSDKNGQYNYGTANHGRYALLSTDNHSNIRYDQNGHITHKGNQVFDWNIHGKPTKITNGNVTNEFKYGPSRARYWHREISNGAPNDSDDNYQKESSNTQNGLINRPYTRDTLYIGGGYEKVTTTRNGIPTVQHKYTLSVGGATVGIYTRVQATSNTPSSNYTRYFHKDALGSITAITDQQGKVIDRYRYRPFGEQIALGGDHQPPEAALGIALTNRGYTGHEHLRGLNLIHMNGRVYDPTLGRFMSADPYVQFANHTQGYNRYAYVQNNPLKYTDPSGYFLKKLIKILSHTSIFGYLNRKMLERSKTYRLLYQAAVGVVSVMTGQVWLNAVAAAQVAAAQGADDMQIFAAGFTAYVSAVATAGIGAQYNNLALGASGLALLKVEIGRAVTHGLMQGLMAKVQGGSFKDGFIGGAVGSIAGHIAPMPDFLKGAGFTKRFMRAVYAGAISGSVSKAGGGSFANGAISGAFVQMFNADGGGTSTDDEQNLTNPTGGEIRGCDGQGCGHYGATRVRNGQEGNHIGSDYISEAGQNVVAISDGRVIRIPSGNYSGIVVGNGAGTSWKILYLNVDPAIRVGSQVTAGQVLGTAQDLTARYANITNHVHVKLRINGQVVNPERYIPRP